MSGDNERRNYINNEVQYLLEILIRGEERERERDVEKAKSLCGNNFKARIRIR